MMTKIIAMSAGLLLTTAACIGGGDGDGKAEIQIALEASGDTSLAYKEQIDRFNESHPDINVELRTYSGGDPYNQAIMGQAAGGIAPDVFLLDAGVRTQTFAESGTIRPLEDLVQGSGLTMGAFEPSLVDAFRVDGELYAIPKDFNATMLFFHKDMLEEAGVSPPKQLEDIRAAAKTLTTGDVFGLGMYAQINYFLAWIQAAGGELVSEEGVQSLQDPGHYEAVSLLQEMFAEDESAASPDMVGASWDGEMFANREVAMVFGGTWIPLALKAEKPGLKISAALWPGPPEAGSVLYTAGWAVSAGSEEPEAAIELIEFLTSDEELVKGHEAGIIGLPPTSSAMKKLRTQEQGDPTLRLAQQAAEAGVPFGWLEPEFVDQYNKMLEELVRDPAKDPRDEIDSLSSELDA